MQERDGVMVFRPSTGLDIVVSSPEQLANSGIYIHPNAIREMWGPDAIERYRQAMVSRAVDGTMHTDNQLRKTNE